ncbi:adenosylcobinamide kinase /adenosylcobinamide-phosphate guanylyltransferase [Austwickia chelonae]|uniref:Adenosylcobinamide kinase n=1 Tax=Austwickia chelonae NBRC 105200 TaxID=1184607 RepID=K6ULH4_9MICO|nr:bifunctional adenosylcobinamide kinase/adenosylcobinamide-phosphate guanylyltransferase [Austwickia chelonae]GAB77251.1 adenosyl cobinamide kinase/adenosyl cobinamide phosphate guanylyltransferase [Austwickia chelonae NBRC 105200]SEW06183.1 adenosylcobinamide kinase /adenosylcobinamide-phosphate guanylyltransferase [Austwickia chelonae]
MSKVLVLGGVRSGKSRFAERLVSGFPSVTYVAPGPVPDPMVDPEWAARVAVHQRSRPRAWRTCETADVPGAVRDADQAVMVDCLGTWVSRVVDDAVAWEEPARARQAVVDAGERLSSALDVARYPVVMVSNEVGLGVVPDHPSGRLFRDLIGRLNAGIADCCDQVYLVLAGRVVDLGGRPRIDDIPVLSFSDYTVGRPPVD